MSPLALQTNPPPLRLLQRYERIAERLADDIRHGRLRPGARLPSERELARRLEVGRASVREALAALQVEGVLETRPGSGSFVAADALEQLGTADGDGDGDRDRDTLELPHDASPSDLLETRLLLEPRVARLAAQRGRRDPELEARLAAMEAATEGAAADPAARAAWNESDRHFHLRLAGLTGNPVLYLLAGQLAELMDQPLWQRLRDDSIAVPGRTRLHLAEHRMIYEAVVDGALEPAEFYATQHLERVRRYMTLD